MKFSMVATLIGSYWVHKPPGPRKVGMPLSAEMPAPVSATPLVAAASSRAASSMSEALLSLVAGRRGCEHELRAIAAADRGVAFRRGLGRERSPGRAGRFADRDHLVHGELVGRLALELQTGHLVHRDVVLARVERRLTGEDGEGRCHAAET